MRASMSGCRGYQIFPLLGGSFQPKEHQKGSASAAESHCVVMGLYLHKRPGVSSHALFGYSLSANAAQSCKQIEQYWSAQDLQSGLQNYKSLKEGVYVCVCVSCVHDSHIRMELLALKHEWLFHGPAETPCPCPCPCLSRAEQEEQGWSFRSDQNSCLTAEKRQYAANAAGQLEVCGIRANARKSANLLLLQSLRLILLPAHCDLRWPDFYSTVVSLPLTSCRE